jgi:hypothetical protein
LIVRKNQFGGVLDVRKGERTRFLLTGQSDFVIEANIADDQMFLRSNDSSSYQYCRPPFLR